MCREMNLLSNCEKMDGVSSDEISNPIEREVAKIINGSIGENDAEAFLYSRGLSSQENKIRNFHVENENPRHDRIDENLFK